MSFLGSAHQRRPLRNALILSASRSVSRSLDTSRSCYSSSSSWVLRLCWLMAYNYLGSTVFCSSYQCVHPTHKYTDDKYSDHATSVTIVPVSILCCVSDALFAFSVSSISREVRRFAQTGNPAHLNAHTALQLCSDYGFLLLLWRRPGPLASSDICF